MDEGALKKEVAEKPRKLLSLQYNYSDSEDEETREERKARIVSILIIIFCIMFIHIH
jgi:hypothetical protein